MNSIYQTYFHISLKVFFQHNKPSEPQYKSYVKHINTFIDVAKKFGHNNVSKLFVHKNICQNLETLISEKNLDIESLSGQIQKDKMNEKLQNLKCKIFVKLILIRLQKQLKTYIKKRKSEQNYTSKFQKQIKNDLSTMRIIKNEQNIEGQQFELFFNNLLKDISTEQNYIQFEYIIRQIIKSQNYEENQLIKLIFSNNKKKFFTPQIHQKSFIQSNQISRQLYHEEANHSQLDSHNQSQYNSKLNLSFDQKIINQNIFQEGQSSKDIVTKPTFGKTTINKPSTSENQSYRTIYFTHNPKYIYKIIRRF